MGFRSVQPRRGRLRPSRHAASGVVFRVAESIIFHRTADARSDRLNRAFVWHNLLPSIDPFSVESTYVKLIG